MPGLILVAFVAVSYDVVALDRGWQTITSAVKQSLRHPVGARMYSALRRHFEED